MHTCTCIFVLIVYALFFCSDISYIEILCALICDNSLSLSVNVGFDSAAEYVCVLHGTCFICCCNIIRADLQQRPKMLALYLSS